MSNFKEKNGTNGQFPSFLLEGINKHPDRELGLRWLAINNGEGKKFCSEVFRVEYNLQGREKERRIMGLASNYPKHARNLLKLLIFVTSKGEIAFPLMHIQNITQVFLRLGIKPARNINLKKQKTKKRKDN